jgi:hypothetical protein
MGKNFYMPGSQVIGGGPKLSNTQMKAEADRLMGIYANAQMELRDEELGGMQEYFNEWVNKTDDIERYKDLMLTDPTRILVRIFKFSKKNETPILGFTEKYKILPYAKVLQVGQENHTPFLVGDILYAPAGITKFETNMEWIAWNKSKEESPGLELPEPAKTRGMLQTWKEDSMFVLDYFNRIPEDEETFLRSALNFPGVYKRANV